MSIVPCQRNDKLKKLIEEYAEVLKKDAHNLGNHGLTEEEFYDSGLFRGAIERIRGQFSASMTDKREFVSAVLDDLKSVGFIKDWDPTGTRNRHDYSLSLPNGKVVAIELKGCLDGNNTNIFERPPNAEEFIVWSVCTNPGADPQHNVWSGLHTRLGAEIISKNQVIDGVVVWDMVCGTVGRPCPKLNAAPNRVNELGKYHLPPPCLYAFPATVPSPRNNPEPRIRSVDQVEFLKALSTRFGSNDTEHFSVGFQVRHDGNELLRKTTVTQDKRTQRESEFTALQRS